MFNPTETWDDQDALVTNLQAHPERPVRTVLPQSMADRRVYWVLHRAAKRAPDSGLGFPVGRAYLAGHEKAPWRDPAPLASIGLAASVLNACSERWRISVQREA